MMTADTKTALLTQGSSILNIDSTAEGQLLGHLKEASVGIENGWQVTADIGVHRCLNEDVLEPNFYARRPDANSASQQNK